MQPDGDIIGQVVAPQVKNLGVTEAIFNKDRHIRRAAANIDNRHPHMPLLRAQDGTVTGQWFEHQFIDINAMRHYTLDQIVHRRATAGHNVGIDLQTIGIHAQRLLHIVLPINGPVARNRVNHLLILGQGHRPCPF